LECVGVRQRAWARLDPLTLIQLTHTPNPLRAFVPRYQEVVLKRTLAWIAQGHVPRFEDAVAIFQNDLLLGDRLRSLEILARIGRTKSAPYIAGAMGAGLLAGASILSPPVALGLAFGVGKTIKDLTKLAVDVRDDLSLFDILRTRRELRRYVEQIGLTS
jgi:hypothetical protein